MNGDAESAEEGFVYVATGERYISEAAASAETLRRHHPQARICLITDQPRGVRFWDDLVILDKPNFGFLDKIQMHRCPYRSCIFLDTDTAIIGDLGAIFTILKRYDVCGAQISEGQNYIMDGGIPPAFPEMNSGFIGFRHGPATEEFFALWEHYYAEFRSLNETGLYRSENIGDQKSLRASLWHSNVRHFGVGAEFNFMPFKSELVCLPVTVLHTRVASGLGRLVSRVNGHVGPRVYFPSLDAVVYDAMSGSELRRLIVAITRLLLRAMGRACVPRKLRDWLRFRRGPIGWLFANYYESPTSRSDFDKWGTPQKERHDRVID